jgi:uncharacterized membrane protein YqiK
MICLGLKTLVFLAAFLPYSLGFAADNASTLTVTTQNANLYASQDNEGKIITTLARGEVLKPFAQGAGFTTWYMVKTSKGVVGWIQEVDVASTQRTNEIFRDRSEVDAKDVTTKTQIELNRENAKREAEANQRAEARATQERQRAAELERAKIRAQADLDAARIQAQGEIEAAKRRQPDCFNCVLLR